MPSPTFIQRKSHGGLVILPIAHGHVGIQDGNPPIVNRGFHPDVNGRIYAKVVIEIVDRIEFQTPYRRLVWKSNVDGVRMTIRRGPK